MILYKISQPTHFPFRRVIYAYLNSSYEIKRFKDTITNKAKFLHCHIKKIEGKNES